MSLLKGLNSVQDLLLNVPAANHPWLFWDFVKLYQNRDSFFLSAKAAIHSKRRNFYEISPFLKPVNRLMHPYALKKAHCLKPHILSPVQKKIFPYI